MGDGKIRHIPLYSLAFAAALLLPVVPWAPAVANDGVPVDTPAKNDDQASAEDAWQKLQNERLRLGDELLKQGQPEAAIRDAFDPIIQESEAKYRSDDTIYFCVRTQSETLLYLLGVAALHDKGESGKNGVALAPSWAYAYYGKAYALIELNRFEEAGQSLDHALKLSPNNPQFLTERGFVYRASREWDKMLESHRAALANIEVATPDNLQKTERARALRGEGYALIELGQLDEAERSFKKSLKIEPRNKIALDELDYIKRLRQQKQ